MLLQKCCHDLDILQWLLGKECKRIQSFGSRNHFRIENAPEGAPERCTDGCPHADKCYYNAIRLYYDAKTNAWFRDACAQKPNPTDEEVWHALETTQYGKCVYKCDNDVVDHQTVNMEFEDGTTVVHTMNAFNKGGRYTHIFGTKGHLYADMGDKNNENFRFYNFETRKTEILEANITTKGTTIVSGHGGGDKGIVVALYDYINGTLSAEDVSEIGISCENHLMSFAAEESRLNGTIIDMDEYRKKYMYE
jgi:predicted dehydrogenase